MSIVTSSRASDCLVQKYVGSSYDVVKTVADNINDIVMVSASLSDITMIINNLNKINEISKNLPEISSIPLHVNSVREDAITTSEHLKEITSIHENMDTIHKEVVNTSNIIKDNLDNFENVYNTRTENTTTKFSNSVFIVSGVDTSKELKWNAYTRQASNGEVYDLIDLYMDSNENPSKIFTPIGGTFLINTFIGRVSSSHQLVELMVNVSTDLGDTFTPLEHTRVSGVTQDNIPIILNMCKIIELEPNSIIMLTATNGGHSIVTPSLNIQYLGE